jgi:hypothetical protein
VYGLGMADQVDSLGGVGYSAHEEGLVKVEDPRYWFLYEGQARGKTRPLNGRRHRQTNGSQRTNSRPKESFIIRWSTLD